MIADMHDIGLPCRTRELGGIEHEFVEIADPLPDAGCRPAAPVEHGARDGERDGVACFEQALAQHLRIAQHALLPVGGIVSDQEHLHGTMTCVQ